MSNWIPKEKLTAYQRWELAAFDEQESAAPARVAPATALARPPPAAPAAPAPAYAPEPEPEPEEEESPLVLPTAADIERMHCEAYATGHAEGYQEGIAAARAEAQKISALLNNLQQALAEIDQGIADQLLAVAIEIAHQVLRQSLRVQPELILPVIREAVTTLHPHHGQPLLFVHPDDAALVRSQLGDQLAHHNWRIVEDPTLTPGGCRVQLGASEVDATLETRWRRVVEAIGVDREWLPGGPAGPSR